MKNTIRLIIIIIFLLLIGIFAFTFYNGLNKPVEKNSEEMISVEIPMGSSTSDIAEILYSNGLINSVTRFKALSKLNGYDGGYVAGSYSLSPGMTPKEICETIVAGDTVNMQFTIPEGYTYIDIRRTLLEKGYVNANTFDDCVLNGDYSEYDFLKNLIRDEYWLEGYLFPDTYIVHIGTSEEDVIKMMLDRFNEIYTDEFKARAKELKKSTKDIITIASIIEKESMLLEDKPLVSSVIYNRLEADMPLQMDTTVIYALQENKLDLTYDDIAIDSPYNTYLFTGLPKGPICCPGEDSIKAALYPADTDYYFFVVSAKGDGSIKFSETGEEFYKDTEEYYASREEQEKQEEKEDDEG